MAGSGQDGGPPPDPRSVEYREGTPVAVGTGIWALLLVVALIGRSQLVDAGRGWWIWTAAAGVVLGGVGQLYLRRRHRRAAAGYEGAAAAGPAGSVNT